MNLTTLKGVILGLLVAACPVLTAQIDDTERTTNEIDLPKTGIRFVICTTGSGQIPSPLYAKIGKEYYPVNISKMMPTPRITPEKGVIKFYDKMPEKGNKAEKLEPVLTINVPERHLSPTTKSLCILQPRKKDDTEPLSFFLKESEFKRGSVHIINFTNNTLEMITDPSGKFEGNEKHEKIAPRVKTRDISPSDANTWSISMKNPKAQRVDSKGQKIDYNEEKVSYILRTMPTPANPEGRRIRASVLLLASDMSQVSIVVDHPRLKDTCSLLSVQFADDEKAGTLTSQKGEKNGGR